MDDVEAVERYIILLLGVDDGRPIPSATHLQKELFILGKANPKVEGIIGFEKHHFGPYSVDLNDISKNPIHHPDAFVFDSERKRFYITDKGKELYREMIRDYGKDPRFEEFLSMMRMVRGLYDGLTTEELLLLICTTYEEYTERSRKSKELLSSPKRMMLARRLLDKGLITRKRFSELVGG